MSMLSGEVQISIEGVIIHINIVVSLTADERIMKYVPYEDDDLK